MVVYQLQKNIEKIKLLILDVDGVLTDNRVVISNDGDEIKNFHVKDGLGILLLQKFGLKVAIITGKTSKIVRDRMSALGVVDIYQGQKNKFRAYNDLLRKYKLNKNDVACMGDDLPDLVLMKHSAVSFAPCNAVVSVKSYADYITLNKGGYGAVREVCDLILEHKGFSHKILKDYINLGEPR